MEFHEAKGQVELPQEIKWMGYCVFYSMGISSCFYTTLATKKYVEFDRTMFGNAAPARKRWTSWPAYRTWPKQLQHSLNTMKSQHFECLLIDPHMLNIYCPSKRLSRLISVIIQRKSSPNWQRASPDIHPSSSHSKNSSACDIIKGIPGLAT